ncbi:hypothetical protein B217_00337 [Bifidobacterium bifidum IPLA 20015]|nr:hypothetical protein B217_00337 [Bifidobacterium bifidum IPLA 20015]
MRLIISKGEFLDERIFPICLHIIVRIQKIGVSRQEISIRFLIVMILIQKLMFLRWNGKVKAWI